MSGQKLLCRRGGINDKKCCCFCGNSIQEFPQYILNIQKSNTEETELATQELF